MVQQQSPRRAFRILTRRRGAYGDALIVDVQLQVAATGALVWAQSFSDEKQAAEFESQLEIDLDELDDGDFRRKYGVPSSV